MSEFAMPRSARGALRVIMLTVFWSSIVLSLLNYGAVEIQTVVLLSLPVYIMTAALALLSGLPEPTRPALLSAVALLVFVFAVVGLQATPLPFGWLAQPSWQDIAGVSPDVGGTISLTPGDDWASALRVALPAGVFMLSLLLFDTDDRALSAIRVMAVSGGVVSVLSILQFELAPDTLLFWSKIAYFDSLTGFFVNRNTAATYFGLMALLNLAMLLRALGEPRIGVEDVLRWWHRDPKLPAIGYGFWFTASLVALMLTKSRAGLLAGVVAIACLLVCRLFRRSKGSSMGRRRTPTRVSPWLKRVIQLALVVIVLIVTIDALGGRTLLRAETQGIGDSRYCVMPGIWSAIVNQLPWGAGLASFEDVFPAYRDPACGLYGLWNRAHNFYLEGLFTFGLMFVPMVGLPCIMLARFFWTGMRHRRGLRFAPEVGVSAVLLVATHAAFDFSLQISGMAVVAALLIAPTVTISLNPPGRRKAKESPAAPHL